MNKRGFDSVSRAFFCAVFSPFPGSILLSFYFLYTTQAAYHFIFFFSSCTLQVSNHLPFAYLLLTSLSSTPLHYEVQLSITPGKFIYIFLDSFTFQNIYITISFLVCLMHVSRSTKTCIAFLHYWLPGE